MNENNSAFGCVVTTLYYIIKQVDANRDIEEVCQDVFKIFGELPKLGRKYVRVGK